MSTLTVLSPHDGSVVYERPLSTAEQVKQTIATARAAFPAWRSTSLAARLAIVEKFHEVLLSKREELGKEITLQMGRPIRYTANEINTTVLRSRFLASVAPKSLADVNVEEDMSMPGFKRYIRKEPVGVVFIVAAWNYPYLVTINALTPALLAGNTVVLKHAPQTPLVAERLVEAFKEAGLPEGVFQYIHTTNEIAEDVVRNGDINFVNLVGSVRAGRAVSRAAAGRHIGVGLELGGKDPAYVRSDADLAFASENIVDGALFNSGQSCCAVERVFVHESVYDEFLTKVVDVVKGYKVGNPLENDTTLGPVVNLTQAKNIRELVADAVAKGARSLIDASHFAAPSYDTYIAPVILADATDEMRISNEETFGPVVLVRKVKSDEEAVQLMNKSEFGLTASIWSKDLNAAEELGSQIEAGTVFLNRCDYLDPALPWSGAKASSGGGPGCTLSRFGFDAHVRLKGYHLRIPAQ